MTQFATDLRHDASHMRGNTTAHDGSNDGTTRITPAPPSPLSTPSVGGASPLSGVRWVKKIRFLLPFYPPLHFFFMLAV